MTSVPIYGIAEYVPSGSEALGGRSSLVMAFHLTLSLRPSTCWKIADSQLPGSTSVIRRQQLMAFCQRRSENRQKPATLILQDRNQESANICKRFAQDCPPPNDLPWIG